MNSSTKICIDSEKLRPKIREWDLFELTLQKDAKKILKIEFYGGRKPKKYFLTPP